MKKLFLLFLGITTFLTTTFCKDLTLQESISLALENNLQIKISNEKVQEARYKKFESVSNFLPKITARGTFTQLDKTPEMNVTMPSPVGTNTITFKLGPDYNYTTSLNLVQPIFTWGRIYNNYLISDLGHKIAREEYKKTKNEIVSETQRLYYTVVLNIQLVNITKEMLKITQKSYESTKKLYQEGKVSKYDLSKVEVQLANVETSLIKAENSLHLVKENFFNFVKLSPQEYNFVTELTYFPVEYKLEELILLSKQLRPELSIIENQQKILNRTKSIISKTNFPMLSFVYNYNYQNPYHYREEWGSNWNVSLAINCDIFTGGATLAKLNQIKSNINQLNYTKDHLEKMIELEVKKYYSDLINAEKRINLQQKNVKLARENLKIAEERYSLGYISILELENVRLALFQTEVEYVSALYDFVTAKVMLEKSVGKKLE